MMSLLAREEESLHPIVDGARAFRFHLGQVLRDPWTTGVAGNLNTQESCLFQGLVIALVPCYNPPVDGPHAIRASVRSARKAFYWPAQAAFDGT